MPEFKLPELGRLQEEIVSLPVTSKDSMTSEENTNLTAQMTSEVSEAEDSCQQQQQFQRPTSRRKRSRTISLSNHFAGASTSSAASSGVCSTLLSIPCSKWLSYLVTMALMGLVLSSSSTHSFVLYDRESSCIRQFSCSADLVGWAMQIDSIESCQKLCDANANCEFFTWREGSDTPSGMFRHFCFLFANCGQLDFDCTDCYSGPKTAACPMRRRNI